MLITGKHLCVSAMMVNAFLNKPDKMIEPQKFKKQNALFSFTIVWCKLLGQKDVAL